MPEQVKYKGYLIRQASPTGGKAGKGCNRTSSVSVSNLNITPAGSDGRPFGTTIRFTVGDEASRRRAWEKAVAWINRAADAPRMAALAKTILESEE